jgi:integrase
MPYASVRWRFTPRTSLRGVRVGPPPPGATRELGVVAILLLQLIYTPSTHSCQLSTASGDRWEALYIIAIHTGLRRGEILGLHWVDVNLEVGTLAFVRRSLDTDGTLKGPKRESSRRKLRLTLPALSALKAHRVRQNEERLKAGATCGKTTTSSSPTPWANR